MTQTHKGKSSFSPKKSNPDRSLLEKNFRRNTRNNKVVDALAARKSENRLITQTHDSKRVVGNHTENEDKENATSAIRNENLKHYGDDDYFRIFKCDLNLNLDFSDIGSESDYLWHFVTLRDAKLLEAGTKFTFLKGWIEGSSSSIKLLCPDLCKMIFAHINFKAIMHGSLR